MGELMLVVYLGTVVWVYFDAQALGARRGLIHNATFDMGPIGWALSCALLWIIGFPAYLANRGQIRVAGERERARNPESKYRRKPTYRR